MSVVLPTSKLSIIVTAYNAAEFLRATVGSCLALAPAAGEVIVIDDGSTDETPDVCSSFGDAIRCERVKNGGVSRARNIGAGMASGEWLLFLDGDDCLMPGGSEALVSAAEAAGGGVAYGLVNERQAPPHGARITGQSHAAGNPPLPAVRNYWRGAVITPGSAIIRRDLHEKIGGFVPGYEPMEDRDYWIKAGLLEPCAHADCVVLDKTWRPVSAGKMDARRIWNGLRSRLALPVWCAERNMPWPDELPRDEKTLLEHAVNEAVWCKCWEIVGPLLAECRRRRIRTFWTLRAGAEFALRGGARRYPAPAWLVPLDLTHSHA